MAFSALYNSVCVKYGLVNFISFFSYYFLDIRSGVYRMQEIVVKNRRVAATSEYFNVENEEAVKHGPFRRISGRYS